MSRVTAPSLLRLSTGLLAGTLATAPMTLVMHALHRQLPWTQRYSIPPRRITLRLAERVGLRRHMSPEQQTAATYASHFAYGAAMGALFTLFAPRVPGTPVQRGMLFGLAVWAGSYLGLLPAAGIHRSATHEPAGRNRMMILAHLVWGAATGWLTHALRLAVTEGASRPSGMPSRNHGDMTPSVDDIIDRYAAGLATARQERLN